MIFTVLCFDIDKSVITKILMINCKEKERKERREIQKKSKNNKGEIVLILSAFKIMIDTLFVRLLA